MRAALTTTLVLVAGNALLWHGEWRGRDPRRFDFAGFEAETRRILAPRQVEPVRFEPNDMLPDDYLYLESVGDNGPFVSVYVGYYPEQGLMAKEPHDPLVCYQAMGWRIAERIDPQPTAETSVHEIVVEQQGERRRALYWRQDGTPASGAAPSLAERILSGRSDLAWVRLEVADGEPERVWAARLLPAVRDLVGRCLR